MATLRTGRAVTRYLRKYVVAPRYDREQRISLTTSDGVGLNAWKLQGPSDAFCTVVLVHGFVNWSRAPRVYAFAHLLARRAHVVVPDLRGHGESGGLCSMGRFEPLDVAAAAAAAPPGLPVVTVGMSLGGAAVLLHAGSAGGVAGTVAISAPAWGQVDREGSTRARRWVSGPAGRVFLSKVLRTRVAVDCEFLPEAEEVVAAIAPAFTIVVHDPDDWYFGPQHAEAIYGWANEPKALWWYEDAGHGTDLLTPAFADRLLAELATRVTRPAPDPSP
ncbi:MAG TPA: alpha/beta fold hydrolase [Acidimicrobiales bacterium]|nr:alpha/beta fold hydrolase [Acidimicrobiales bacterium]